MDVLRSCIVCCQLYRDDYRYLVAASGAMGKGIFDDGLFRNSAVCIHAVKGAARSA